MENGGQSKKKGNEKTGAGDEREKYGGSVGRGHARMPQDADRNKERAVGGPEKEENQDQVGEELHDTGDHEEAEQHPSQPEKAADRSKKKEKKSEDVVYSRND